jgi:hypothetical protein
MDITKILPQEETFVILGGGTAGWMAAIKLLKHFGKNNKVILVESASVPTIGVGEGSTPQLKHFFDSLSISEQEWMPACDASYKLGIKFEGWATQRGVASYFHPFPSQLDTKYSDTFLQHTQWRRKGLDVEAHPDAFFLNNYLMSDGLSPQANITFPFTTNYGYHFDATKLAAFLKSKAIKNGLEYINEHIEHVEQDQFGNVVAILSQKRRIEGSHFIDCSGFKRTINKQAFDTPFHSYSDSLLNDAAVTVSTPISEPSINYTRSIAMDYGWMWQIPLTQRVGNGYVYSKRFCTAEQAELELRKKLGIRHTQVNFKHINMKVGRLTEHWTQNCLTLGLSQGFIEPLEATALHVIIETLDDYIRCISEGGQLDSNRRVFNTKINHKFDSIRDYIVAHYKLNSNTHTNYWATVANSNVLSQSLHAVLSAWMAGERLLPTLKEHGMLNAYSEASWNCLLSGYGIFPDASQLKPLDEHVNAQKMREVTTFYEKCASHFPPNSSTHIRGSKFYAS